MDENAPQTDLDTGRKPLFPPEIITEIFSYLPRSTLLRFRQLNRVSGAIATRLAFHHILLDGQSGCAERFLRVASSEKLRPLVREITCDPYVGPDHYYSEPGATYDHRPIEEQPMELYPFPNSFMNVLPSIRFFNGLKSLHIRFQPAYESSYDYPGTEDLLGPEVEESTDLRYRVLDIIFRCLDGTWVKWLQEFINDGLPDLVDRFDPFEDTLPIDYEIVNELIALRTLTITNLACDDDERLISSAAFRRVMMSKTIVDFRICVTAHNEVASGTVANWRAWDMYRSLPYTWLTPHLASNLKVLSLFVSMHEFGLKWGWFPRMDFREIWPEPPFPQLKTLALGGYIFSHEWQVEWITSLGKENAAGGLEELHLINCSILHAAHSYQDAQEDDTGFVIKDYEGKDVMINCEGYPTKDILFADFDRPTDTVTYSPLRWHSMLSAWRKNMKALRIFHFKFWDKDKVQEFRESALGFIQDLRYHGQTRNESNDDLTGYFLEHLVDGQDFRYFREYRHKDGYENVTNYKIATRKLPTLNGPYLNFRANNQGLADDTYQNDEWLKLGPDNAKELFDEMYISKDGRAVGLCEMDEEALLLMPYPGNPGTAGEDST